MQAMGDDACRSILQNRITLVAPGAFQPLTQLFELFALFPARARQTDDARGLGSNPLEFLPPDVFANQQSLRILCAQLRRCRILSSGAGICPASHSPPFPPSSSRRLCR